MRKSDLRTGMRVTTKGGRNFMVFIGCDHAYSSDKDFIANGTTRNWNRLSSYDECLISRFEEDSIVRVEIPIHPYDLQDITSKNYTAVWEREDPKNMTVAEIEKELGYSIKIIK